MDHVASNEPRDNTATDAGEPVVAERSVPAGRSVEPPSAADQVDPNERVHPNEHAPPAEAPAPVGSGRPFGRRLFLGLVGAGLAGLVWQRYSLLDDDANVANVAVSVPLTDAGQPDQREALEGVHPNESSEGRFRYYSVGDVPSYTERTYRLTVDGEGVDGNLSLRYTDVKAFPNVAIRSTFRCVNGWRVKNNIWRGVRLRDVLDAAAPNSHAKFVTFYSGDGVYTESLTWAQARSNNALLVWELNGQPMIREQGWPMRLIYPDMYGYKNIKWLARIEVKSGRDLGFWESHSGWEIDAYVYNPDQVQQG